MEIKKYPEVDLKKKSGLFFQVGLVISLGLVLAAFNYTTRDEVKNTLGELEVSEEIEVIENTVQEVKPPPPPPPPTLEIVEDTKEIKESPKMQETEATQETKVEPIVKQKEEEAEKTDEPEIFMVVEEQPEFPGGDLARQKFLASNINYPPLAKENGIEGKVVVNFIVDTDGSITNPRVVSKPIGWGLEEEALRVVKQMPRWKAGKQRGKAVKVSFNLPIRFTLQ